MNSRWLIPLAVDSSLTKLLLRTRHQEYGHVGTSTIIGILGHHYYIVGIKRSLKGIARKCTVCQQANAHTKTQQMGMLPDCRTQLAPPFTITGVDMAGPVTLREGATRKPVCYKACICIFVCMVTKAVHIEVCRSLEVEEFQAALMRFSNRRGTPAEIHSDNGGNFVGTAKELAAITRMMRETQSHTQDIKWHFNPPRSPNFGGLWEAGVKSAKKLMKKMVQPHHLRMAELMNVLTDVEALLNSRPLISLEEVEMEDELMLTPGHFLIQRPLKAPPTALPSQAKISSLRRWQLTKRLAKDLEKEWKGCYINSLQSRSRWRKESVNPSVGDLVFIKDDTLMRNSRWPLGKIVKLHPGPDKKVRTVDVQHMRKTNRRATSMLVPLDITE